MDKPEALWLADRLQCNVNRGIHWDAAAELRRLHALVSACEPYLKEGETPAERIERERRDTEAVCRLYAKERERNVELLEALKKRDSVEQHLNSEIENHSAAVYEATKLLSEARDRRDELLEALRWIERRCPAQLLLKDLHRIHMEAAHDAGACARAAIARAEGELNERP